MIPQKHTSEFRDAVAAVMMATPFFATLLLRYQHICDPKIPTACVSKRTLRYNPEWFASLKPEGRLAVLVHEVCHGIYKHVEVQQGYAKDGLDGKPLVWDRWARAIDYVVNATVKESRVGVLPDSAVIDMVKFPAGMMPEEVYRRLTADEKGGGGGSARGKGQPLDQHGHDEDDAEGDASDKPCAIDEASIVNAANVAKSLGGHVPDSIDRLIGELVRPKIDPYGVLRRFISTISNGRDNSTMRNLNRKLLTRGVGAPGRDSYRLTRVGVVIDTSGSIGDSLIAEFLGNVALILQQYKPREVRIAWTDTKVHRVDEIKDVSGLEALRRKGAPGGGGTNIEVAYEALGRCDCYVMLTDGYTPFTKAPKAPVVWAMTTNVVAPYGTTVRITP